MYDCKGKTGPSSRRKEIIVAEEQGGFRKGRRCRDQILTLMLVGQVLMAIGKVG